MQINKIKFYVWRDESIIGEHIAGFLSGDITGGPPDCSRQRDITTRYLISYIHCIV